MSGDKIDYGGSVLCCGPKGVCKCARGAVAMQPQRTKMKQTQSLNNNIMMKQDTRIRDGVMSEQSNHAHSTGFRTLTQKVESSVI